MTNRELYASVLYSCFAIDMLSWLLGIGIWINPPDIFRWETWMDWHKTNCCLDQEYMQVFHNFWQVGSILSELDNPIYDCKMSQGNTISALKFTPSYSTGFSMELWSNFPSNAINNGHEYIAYLVLYYNVGTGTVMAGQTMARFFFPANMPNLMLFMFILCVFLFPD